MSFLNSDFAKSLLKLYWVHEWTLFFEVVQKTLKAFDSLCCSLSDCVIQFLHHDAVSCTWLKLNSYLVWLMLCQALVSLTLFCHTLFLSVCFCEKPLQQILVPPGETLPLLGLSQASRSNNGGHGNIENAIIQVIGCQLLRSPFTSDS